MPHDGHRSVQPGLPEPMSTRQSGPLRVRKHLIRMPGAGFVSSPGANRPPGTGKEPGMVMAATGGA